MAYPKNLVMFDTETSGLLPDEGARILELAAIVVRGLEIVDEFTCQCWPGQKAFENPGAKRALEINGLIVGRLLSQPWDHEQAPRLAGFLEKHDDVKMLSSYNIRFDRPFLCIDPWNLHTRVPWAEWGPDPMLMATEVMGLAGQLPSRGPFDWKWAKLREACGYLKVDQVLEHTALSDARAAACIYITLANYLS